VLPILRLSFIFMLFVPAAASASMPLRGTSSKPVGHYEFCQSYADRCGPNEDV
jgi:predicted transglutaminase-like cysteine proteinase